MVFTFVGMDIKEFSLTENYSNTWKIEARSHKLQDTQKPRSESDTGEEVVASGSFLGPSGSLL